MAMTLSLHHAHQSLFRVKCFAEETISSSTPGPNQRIALGRPGLLSSSAYSTRTGSSRRGSSGSSCVQSCSRGNNMLLCAKRSLSSRERRGQERCHSSGGGLSSVDPHHSTTPLQSSLHSTNLLHSSLHSTPPFHSSLHSTPNMRRGMRHFAASNGNDTEPETTAVELERLERELEAAVESEDYSAAANLRDQLRRLQDDEEAAVVAANSLFYRAFQNSDMRRMGKIWAKEDHVQCIHPGSNCIQGYDMVMESWDVILSGERRLQIDVDNMRCYVRGSMAIVTCVEVLRSEGAAGMITATNIFEKRNGQWLLVLHQGAAAPPNAFIA